jgi:hypothetical protein
MFSMIGSLLAIAKLESAISVHVKLYPFVFGLMRRADGKSARHPVQVSTQLVCPAAQQSEFDLCSVHFGKRSLANMAFSGCPTTGSY